MQHRNKISMVAFSIARSPTITTPTLRQISQRIPLRLLSSFKPQKIYLCINNTSMPLQNQYNLTSYCRNQGFSSSVTNNDDDEILLLKEK